MQWTVTNPPDSEPITYAQCKAQARVDGDGERDWINSVAIPAVRASCEKECQLSLITREITVTAYDGHEVLRNLLRLPRGPVQAVSSVTGNGNAIDASQYELIRRGLTDYLRFKTLPELPIVAVYSAGYGDASEIPDDLRAAMLAHFCFMYENRSANAEPTALDRFYRQYRAPAG